MAVDYEADGMSYLEAKRKYEQFVSSSDLALPEEVAELFEAYTRRIWQYKEVGRIYDFYSDITTCYGENGRVSVGADGVVAGTLSFMRSFPDRKCVFVDIFAEGNQQDGYHQVRCAHGQGARAGRHALPLDLRVRGAQGRGSLADRERVGRRERRRHRRDNAPGRAGGRVRLWRGV